MKKFICLLGSTESQRHTFEVKNEKELKQKLAATWPTSYNGTWKKRKTPNGYPTGTKLYTVTVKMSALTCKSKVCFFLDND
jgi:hypothetical protein